VVQKALKHDGFEEKVADTKPDLTPTFVAAKKQFTLKGQATVFRSYDCDGRIA